MLCCKDLMSKMKGGARRLGAFVLAFAMVMGCMAALPQFDTEVHAASTFGGGSGTSSDPYLISTEAHMRQLATDVNAGTTYVGKYFRMTNDIDLGGSSRPWTPIGNNSTTAISFRGKFDGNGFSVKNMYYSGSGVAGLFGRLDDDTCVIENLQVYGSINVSGGTYAGGLAGFAYSDITIQNCYTNVAINNTANSQYIGGIIGCLYSGGDIRNCEAYGTITSSASGNFGGIVGLVWGSSTSAYYVDFTSPVNYCNINYTGDKGAIVGHIANMKDVDISKCIRLYSGAYVASGRGFDKYGFYGSTTAQYTYHLQIVTNSVPSDLTNTYFWHPNNLIVPQKAIYHTPYFTQNGNVTPVSSSISKTYGNSAFTLDWRTGSSGTRTWSSSNTNVATVSSSGSVTIKGAGTTTIKLSVAANGYWLAGTKSCTLTVNKAASSVSTAPTGFGNLSYTGSAQTLVKAGTASGGTMYYYKSTSSTTPSASASGWSSSLPTATAAGTYNIWYKVVGDSNHNNSSVYKMDRYTYIAKANPTYTAPHYNDQDYTGSPLTLIKNQACSGGTMYYYMSTSSSANPTASASGWSTTAPTATNYGKYYIWWKIVGDSNHNDVAPTKMNAYTDIRKVAPTYTAPSLRTGQTCTGSSLYLINGGSTSHGTIYYYASTSSTAPSSSASGWSTSLPTGTNAGTYYAWYKITGDSNHNNVDVTLIGSVEIGKGTKTITTPTTSFTKNYGAAAFNLGASINRGTIKYESSNTGVVSVSQSGLVTINGVGSAIITVSGPEDSNYNEATSKTIAISVNAVAPGVPTGVTASSGENGQSVIRWTAPTFTGGQLINQYVIQRSSDGGTTWDAEFTTTGSLRAYTDRNLTNGHEYKYRVIAVNATGYSTASSVVSATPYTVPGAVQNLEVRAIDYNAFLIKCDPTGNGGNAITDYEVKAYSDEAHTQEINFTQTAYNPNTTAGYPGFENSRAYEQILYIGSDVYANTPIYITVAAKNAAGVGEKLNASVTLLAPPHKPTDLQTEVVDKNSVKLSYAMPEFTGNTDITKLKIAYKQDGDSDFTETVIDYTDGDELNQTIGELAQGKRTEFKIAAGIYTYCYMSAGNVAQTVEYGEYSDVVTATPAQEPGIAAMGEIESKNSGVLIESLTAADNCGDEITSYVLYAKEVTAEEAANADEDTEESYVKFAELDAVGERVINKMARGLTNGKTYQIAAKAKNAYGEGALSNIATMTIGLPDVPENFTMAPGSNQMLTMSYDEAESNDSSDVVYDLYIGGSKDDTDLSTNTVTIRGTEYHYGEKVTTDALSYDYSAGDRINGDSVTAFVVARNAIGTSKATPVRTSNVGSPSIPKLLSYTTLDDGLNVEWEASQANGTRITKYTVLITNTVTGETTSFDTTGARVYEMKIEKGDDTGKYPFEDGTKYKVAVTCTNGAGTSLPSREGEFTFAAPSAPQEVTAETDDGTLTVSWKAPASTGGYNIIGYNIYLNNDRAATMEVTWEPVEGQENVYQLYTKDLRGSDPKAPYGEPQTGLDAFSVTIGGLANGNKYTARVTAVNKKGEGPAEEIAEPIAPKTEAGAPMGVKAEGISATSAKVSWNPPVRDGGTPVQGYVVKAYKVAKKNLTTLEYEDVEEEKVWESTDVILDTTVTVTGLETEYAYRFEVQAVTAAGLGAVGHSNIAKTYTVPSKPVIYELESGVGNEEHLPLTVRWRAPESNGDTEITGYNVYINSYLMNLNGMLSADSTEYTINDVRINRGETYEVTVAAYNNVSATGTMSEAKTITLGTIFPPRDVQLAGDRNGNLSISWDDAQYDGIKQYIDRYIIYLNGAVKTTSKTSNVNLTMIRPGQMQEVQVAVMSTFGQEGNKSEVKSITLGAPLKVENVTATAGNKSAVISWSAIVDDAAYMPTEYYIYLNNEKIGEVDGNTTTYTAENLAAGREYTVTVAGHSANGVGVSSDPVKVTPWGNPDKPIIEDVRPGVGSVEVDFTIPDGNGSVIDHYEVYVDDAMLPSNGMTATTRDNGDGTGTATITGITDGEDHDIKIIAVNREGEKSPEPPEEEIPTVRPGVPAAPKNIKIEAGNGKATVSFDKSADVAADFPTTGYEVVVYEETESGLTGVNTVSVTAEAGKERYTAEVTGLTDGKKYAFTVRAINSKGTGVESTPINAVIGAPAAPVIERIVPESGKLKVKWTAPEENAGRITKYTVYVNNIEAVTTIDTQAELTGLANGTSYIITVTAHNLVGEGMKSDPMTASPGGKPGVISGFRALANYSTDEGHTITLTWGVPEDNGGITVTDYKVYGSAGDITVDAANRTAKVTGLAADTEYTFEITAVNNAGEGAAYETNAIKTFTTPGMPILSGIDSYNNALVVTWTAPAITGGTPITAYKLYAEDEEGNKAEAEVLPGSEANGSCTATLSAAEHGLVTGNTYKVYVKAVNIVGESPASFPISTKLNDNLVKTAPGAPRNINAAAADAAATITWTAPANDGNSTITEYRIYAGNGENEDDMGLIATVDGYTFTYTETGITNGQTRYYKVKAVNAVDADGGPFSDTVSATPTKINPPTKPEWVEFDNENGVSAYEVNAQGTEMKLTWVASTGDENGGAISYEIYVDGMKVGTVSDETTYTIGDLREGTRYNIQVKAVNEMGGETMSDYIRAYSNLNIRKGSEADGFHYDAQYEDGIYANIDADYNGVEDNRIVYTVPGIPENAQMTHVGAKVIITWDPPTNTGNKPLEGYYVYVNGEKTKIESQPSGRAKVKARGTAEALSEVASDTEIPEGEFTFEAEYGEPFIAQVSAYNEIGEGGLTDQMYLNLATDAPRNFAAAVSADDKTMIDLTWNVPNAGVTGYVLYVIGAQDPSDAKTELSLDDVTIEGDVVSYTYQGEINKDYIFAVSAMYKQKESPQTETKTLSTAEIKANAPKITGFTELESGGITVTWEAPTNLSEPGVMEIDHYDIYVNGEIYDDMLDPDFAGIGADDLSVDLPMVNSSALIKIQAISSYGTEGEMSAPKRYNKIGEDPTPEAGTPNAPQNIDFTLVRENGILAETDNVTFTWEPGAVDADHEETFYYNVYVNNELKGDWISETTITLTLEPGEDYDISIEPVAKKGGLGAREHIVVAVPENEYAKPNAPTLAGEVAEDKSNVTFTWDTEDGVDYFLIVNGDEANAQPISFGDSYTLEADTAYSFIVKAVKTYDDGTETMALSNAVQVNTSGGGDSYLSAKPVILGTLSSTTGTKVKVYWKAPEKLENEKGDISEYRIVVDGAEVSGAVVPAGEPYVYELTFSSLTETKNVQIRAYKTLAGAPFLASTSDVWKATPNCNVVENEGDYDKKDENGKPDIPFDDNGKPTVPVDRPDTTGNGEAEISTGVEIKIPVEVNVAGVDVSLIDQFTNKTSAIEIVEVSDGKYEAVFKSDKSEDQLAGLTFDIEIKKPGYTSYTLKGVPYAEVGNVNIQSIELYAGDLNDDGVINNSDLNKVKANAGKRGGAELVILGDLNGDGVINNADMTRIKANSGKRSKQETWN